MKRVVLIVAALALLAGIAYVAHRAWRQSRRQSQAFGGRGPLAVAVEIAPVRRATLRDVGRFSGSLAPDAQFILAPRIAGRLEKLLVALGDTVRNGQEIARLDDQEYIQQAQRAEAELAVARAAQQECQTNRDLARRELEREETLRQGGISSESTYEQLKAQAEVAEARCRLAAATVEQKEAALNEAKIRSSYTHIVAAWEGGDATRLVGHRYADEGALLAANAPIVSIIDIDPLIAAIGVIERDYARIAVGQAARVTTDAYPGAVFAGQILRIAPQLQESSRQARVEVAVPNPDGRLKPGMFVRVELQFAQHDDVPAVPATALVRRDGRRGVFVADLAEKKARFVVVETGIAADELVEIVEPELTGPVVTLGQHLLGDGGSITVPGPATPSSGPGAPSPEGQRPAASQPPAAREHRP